MNKHIGTKLEKELALASSKLSLLRDRLVLGEEQADRGEFSGYSLKGLIAELDEKKTYE